MDGALLPLPGATDGITALLARHAAEVDREGAFPAASLAALDAAGLLGLTVRRADGGAEAGLARTAAVIEAAGRGCASTALIFAMHLIHTRASWTGRWPGALAARIGRDAANGGLVNALRVEPALGTPARGGLPATVARRVPGGWSLTGRKIYATGAPGLRWMIVFARTDEPEPRMGQFAVPAGTDGIRIEPSWDQLGLRGSCSHDVVFSDAVIAEECAADLRAPAAWAARDAEGAVWSAIGIAALYTGVAAGARDWTASFLRGRVPANLGAPLATLPRMQEAMGRVEAAIASNRRLIRSAAEDTEAGQPPEPAESGLIKTVAAEAAAAAVRECVALAGNHGLSRANPLERHLRDVTCAAIHTPQPDSAYTAAGKRVLDEARSTL